MNEKENLIEGVYSVEVVSSEGNKVLWEVLYDHGIDKENDHDEIGQHGFNFFFDEDKEGVDR